MNVYIQILPEDNNTVRVDGWMPWINAKSESECVTLAAHRYFRENGYMNRGARSNPTIRVLSHNDQDPRHRNGAPKVARVTTITLDSRSYSEP
jgi:hypothetical protein